jgi:hypothetical protein
MELREICLLYGMEDLFDRAIYVSEEFPEGNNNHNNNNDTKTIKVL